LVPGEPEFRYAQRKQNEGIEVDDTTWKAICEEARMFGLNPDQWLC
jgi:LDH2 family malate/lactate/ureidoglycolate dehydrogenase